MSRDCEAALRRAADALATLPRELQVEVWAALAARQTLLEQMHDGSGAASQMRLRAAANALAALAAPLAPPRGRRR